MRIFNDDGWINMPDFINHPARFVFIYAARGTGKTYGALEYVIKNKIPHMYLRRLQAQLEIINKKEFSPYKEPFGDMGEEFISQPVTKNNYGIYLTGEDEAGKIVPGERIGYTGALSTLANLRGFSAEEIEIMFLDEFIPEEQERPIKGELTVLLNAYETINRNRELKGKPALKLVCMANSNNIANPYFIGLRLVERALKMEESQQQYYYDPERSLLLAGIKNSKISEAKSATALYQLMGQESDFNRMALRNKYNIAVRSPIKHPKLTALVCVVNFDEIGVWAYKGDSKQAFHVMFHNDKTADSYHINDINKRIICQRYAFLWLAYVDGLVSFENFMCEVLLQKVFL